ncbi:MAG: M42 family metallopeptidase [Thermoprotei archaeon]
MDAALEKLLSLDGPSGFEGRVRGFLEEEFRKYADRVYTDGLGNLYAEKTGGKSRVMFCAHMDEVGFLVQHITQTGFIRFIPLGGWDERILPGIEVKILGEKEVYGVVSTKPPHITSEAERKKVMDFDELYVDAGLSSKELVELGVEVGTPIVPASTLRVRGSVVKSKALDDRVGCYNLLRLLRQVHTGRDTPTIIFVATVQEEVGTRGAQVVSNTQHADAALILEATVAGDTPNVPDEKCPSKMGEGAVLTVMDKSMIANQQIFRTLKMLAENFGIKHQIKKPGFGGTDGGPLHLGGSGIPTGVISVPCRYIHTPNSYMNLSDVDEALKLAETFIHEFHPTTP